MSQKPSPGLEDRHTSCSICSSLADREYATQKWGWEDQDTFLPAACYDLEIVHDFAPGSNRASQLKKCPGCGTFYLYTTDYEYLVNGTEDEQSLARLTDEEAAQFLKQNK